MERTSDSNAFRIVLDGRGEDEKRTDLWQTDSRALPLKTTGFGEYECVAANWIRATAIIIVELHYKIHAMRAAALSAAQNGGCYVVERLLEQNSTELPNCHCGDVMHLERTRIASADTQIKIFRCAACSRELRLTVWSDQDVV